MLRGPIITITIIIIIIIIIERSTYYYSPIITILSTRTFIVALWHQSGPNKKKVIVERPSSRTALAWGALFYFILFIYFI